MSWNVWSLVYGDKAYCYRGPDNVVRVVCPLPVIVAPYVAPRVSEHRTAPRKDDGIVIISSHDTKEYGKILWVSRDDDACGVLLFKDKRYETFDLSLLESANQGKVRWRIYQ